MTVRPIGLETRDCNRKHLGDFRPRNKTNKQVKLCDSDDQRIIATLVAVYGLSLVA